MFHFVFMSVWRPEVVYTNIIKSGIKVNGSYRHIRLIRQYIYLYITDSTNTT